MPQNMIGPLTIEGSLGGGGGQLELGQNLGATESPYIDFHFGLGSVQDYNARIINADNNRLDFVTESGGTVLSINGSNVGIGTTNPGAKLVVNDSAAVELRVDGNSGVYGLAMGADSNHPWLGSRTNHDLRIFTNNTEKVRIQANGNVGIGTASPNGRLDVANLVRLGLDEGGSGQKAITFARDATDEVNAGKIAYKPSWDVEALAIIGAGTPPNRRIRIWDDVTVEGKLGVGTTNPAARLQVNGGALINGVAIGADVAGINYPWEYETIGVTNTNFNLRLQSPNHIIFHTGDTPTERMIVAENGNVGIGTTWPNGRLDVANFVRFGLDEGGSGPRVITFTRDATDEVNAGKIAYRPGWDNGVLGIVGAGAPGTARRIRMWDDVAVEGKLGIGTASPGAKLHVNGGAIINGVAIGADVPGIDYPWEYETIGVTQPNFNLRLQSPNSIVFHTGDKPTEKMIVAENGSVGIGTISPIRRLHVHSDDWGSAAEIHASGSTAGLSFTNRDAGRTWDNGGAGQRWVWYSSGNFARLWTPSTDDVLMIDPAGTVFIKGLLLAPRKAGYVIDQFVNRLGEALEQGDVVVVGQNQSSLYYGPNNNVPIPEVDIARRAYDTRVCGIVDEVHAPLQAEGASSVEIGAMMHAKTIQESGKPEAIQSRDFTPEELEKLDRTKVEPGQIGGMVTLGAFAHCKVDADIAPIVIGDLLTTSPTKGHVQKVLDPSQAIGAIVGKALGSLEKGKGRIPVLVMLQ